MNPTAAVQQAWEALRDALNRAQVDRETYAEWCNTYAGDLEAMAEAATG